MDKETVLLSLLTIFTIFILYLYRKSKNKIYSSKKRLEGKVAVVTGGTAGIGFEIAKNFASRGARVIIACPFHEEGIEAQDVIKKDTGNNKVVFKHLDLASFKSVRQFAQSVIRDEAKVDILVNNAGVGVPSNSTTEDGLNIIMQVNYFGHFLLTILLLPLLKKSIQGRIISMSSRLHLIGKLDLKHLNNVGSWLPIQNYGISKYCLITFSCELTRRLTGTNVTVNCVDPGPVGTKIYHSVGIIGIGPILRIIFKYFNKTAFEGAQTVLYVAIDDDASQVSGQLFRGLRIIKALASAYRDDVGNTLWCESVKLVKLTEIDLVKSFNKSHF